MIIGLDALNPSAQSAVFITFDSVPGDPTPITLDPARRAAGRTRRAAVNQWNLGLATVAGLSVFRVPPGVNPTFFGAAADRQVRTREALPENEVAQLRELERALNQAQSQGLAPVQAGIPPDLRPMQEQLGTRQIEGLRATGRRTTLIIPTDRVGNDRPIQITDERWESPDLSLVVYSRFSDPRTGVIEYRLTNINRAEPSADLFAVPADYTVPPPPTPPAPGEPGLRRGGPAPVDGQRGGGRGGRSPQ
jgi:hypothetical protein